MIPDVVLSTDCSCVQLAKICSRLARFLVMQTMLCFSFHRKVGELLMPSQLEYGALHIQFPEVSNITCKLVMCLLRDVPVPLVSQSGCSTTWCGVVCRTQKLSIRACCIPVLGTSSRTDLQTQMHSRAALLQPACLLQPTYCSTVLDNHS